MFLNSQYTEYNLFKIYVKCFDQDEIKELLKKIIKIEFSNHNI